MIEICFETVMLQAGLSFFRLFKVKADNVLLHQIDESREFSLIFIHSLYLKRCLILQRLCLKSDRPRTGMIVGLLEPPLMLVRPYLYWACTVSTIWRRRSDNKLIYQQGLVCGHILSHEKPCLVGDNICNMVDPACSTKEL